MLKRTLYHVTHRSNEASINERGLLVECATGAWRIWLTNRNMVDWAMHHACSHHGWDLEDLIAYRVFCPEYWLKRSKWGVYFVTCDLNPLLLERVKMRDALHPQHWSTNGQR